jgi:hypothetical protein
MTVWRLRGDQRELIYQTVVDNPQPDAAPKQDGGVSGLMYIEPGDKLEWSFDVNNTLDQRLRFDNQAYTAEMCLLAGVYISNTAGPFAGGRAGGQCSGRLLPR